MDFPSEFIYDAAMANDTFSFGTLDRRAIYISALRAKKAEVAAYLAEIEQALKQAEAGAPLPGDDGFVDAPKPADALGKKPHHSQVHGLSILQSAVKVVRENGNPMTSREVTDVLTRAGFTTVKEDLYHAVHTQLTKSSKRPNGEIIFFGSGKWSLREWYLPHELKEIEATLNGTPSRDAEHHSERVKEALELAKSRGVWLGRKPFPEIVSQETLEDCRRLEAQGLKASDIAEQVGIKLATYRKWRAWIIDPATPWPTKQ